MISSCLNTWILVTWNPILPCLCFGWVIFQFGYLVVSSDTSDVQTLTDSCRLIMISASFWWVSKPCLVYFLHPDCHKVKVLPCHYQFGFPCVLYVERYVLCRVITENRNELYLIFNWGQDNLLAQKNCRLQLQAFPTFAGILSIPCERLNTVLIVDIKDEVHITLSQVWSYTPLIKYPTKSPIAPSGR